MKLTIQIVNFRSRQYLKDCLFSIGKNLPDEVSAEIRIINNDEKPLGVFDTDLPVIELNENVGFGRAHNIGAAEASGEYILFLNPDTKILPGALEALLGTIAGDKNVGIVGPLLVNAAGKIEPDCFGTSRTPLSIVGRKIFSKRQKKKEYSGIFETDWISGGAMLICREVFKKAGGFDENFFMYFEDVDLCHRVKKSGYKVVVAPVARIFHQGGKSFESNKKKKKYYYDSQDYYLKKNFGPLSAAFVKLLRLPYYMKNVYYGR